MIDRRKQFDWFKFVTISMVVIGVGFFLVSLFLSRRDQQKFDRWLKESQEVIEHPPFASSSSPISHKTNDDTHNQPKDEPIKEANARIVKNREEESPTKVNPTELNPSLLSAEEQELSPEVKLKVEQYAKLAEILPRIRQLQEEASLLAEETRSGIYDAEDDHDKLRQLDAQILAKLRAQEMYYLQIDELFPNLELTEETIGEVGDGYIIHDGMNFHEERLVEYFGKKLPWSGNTDYFQAEER